MDAKKPFDVAAYYCSRAGLQSRFHFGLRPQSLTVGRHLRITGAEIDRYFRRQCNVGILLGEPSGWLVNVDLDHPLAVEIADEFLPTTACVFGAPANRGPASALRRDVTD